jgi:antitoxin component YwqK of YwqJK toxin-antitoxin module
MKYPIYFHPSGFLKTNCTKLKPQALQMKNYVINSIILVFTSGALFAQRITLNELQLFCTNKNWETTNKNLLLQKWDYYNSTKGDDEHYDIITWANGRNYTNDTKATAWLYLYNYDDLPSRIMYRFRQKEYYTAIQSQLKTFGYALTDESIYDEKVTATYENATFVLKIAYKREVDEEDDYYYSTVQNSKRTFTVYEATIFKKGGVYDPNNGFKKDYDEDGTLAFEYFLKNSKLEGKATRYNSDGKITALFNFKNGNKHGKNSTYEFIEDSEVYIETISTYKDGMINGKVIEYVITPEEKYIASVYTYKNDILDGTAFQSRKSVIQEMSYKNNLLEGSYKEYLEMKSVFYGGLGRIDTLAMPPLLLLEQNYRNDKLEGNAIEYDLTGVKIAEGTYRDSLKTGTWKYYYETIRNGDGTAAEGSGKLHRIASYSNGKLDGVSETFSASENVKIDCPEDSGEDDECFKRELIYFHLISNYKEDELDGFYEMKHKNGDLLARGNYENGMREGKWIHYSTSKFCDFEGIVKSYETGNYKNDLKEGLWERIDDHKLLLETYFYKSSKIDGKHVSFKNGQPVLHKYFTAGKFDKFEILENGQIHKSVQLVGENTSQYNLQELLFSANGTELITLTIKKADGFVVEGRDFPTVYQNLSPELKIKNGLYELISKEKQILSTGNYQDNLKNGIWKDVYLDQNVQMKTIWERGVIKSETYWDLKKLEDFSGAFIYLNVQNNTTEERKVKNGKRNGTTRYKDQNDKTIKKESYKEGIIKE